MKIKPVVTNHVYASCSSLAVDFEFTSNIMVVTGDSATGRTASYSVLYEYQVADPRVICLDYHDCKMDIKKFLSEQRGKLIIIDNADTLLDVDVRKFICVDRYNQYLLMGNNATNLLTTYDNIFELVNEKVEGRTVFRLVMSFEDWCR